MDEEIQDTLSIVGKVLLEKYFPTPSVTVPDTSPTPEPVAATPLLKATPLTIGSPIVIVAGLVIAYFVFVKK